MRIDKVQKEEINNFHKNTARILFFSLLISATLIIATDPSNLKYFFIFLYLNYLDIFLTHKMIFSYSSSLVFEVNPYANFLMKIFKNKWWIVAIILGLIVFSLLFLIFPFKNRMYIPFIFGIYTMIIINNLSLFLTTRKMERIKNGNKSKV